MKHILGKILLALAAAVPLICLFFILDFFNNQKYFIFPQQKESLKSIEVLTDGIWNGKSKVLEFTHDSEKMYLKYVLRNSDRDYPNVFIIIWQDQITDKPYVDLSGYDYITLKLGESTQQLVTIFIKTYEEGISSFNHLQAGTLRHNYKELQIVPEIQEYKIKLNDFMTPTWWRDIYITPGTPLSDKPFKKVVSFDLHFIHVDLTPVEEIPNVITINEIAAIKSMNDINRWDIFFVVNIKKLKQKVDTQLL
jgi:hypothetical protein